MVQLDVRSKWEAVAWCVWYSASCFRERTIKQAEVDPSIILADNLGGADDAERAAQSVMMLICGNRRGTHTMFEDRTCMYEDKHVKARSTRTETTNMTSMQRFLEDVNVVADGSAKRIRSGFGRSGKT